jgi:hypothetical protein
MPLCLSPDLETTKLASTSLLLENPNGQEEEKNQTQACASKVADAAAPEFAS